MAKEDTIEIEGKVLEIIPGGKFKVQLENGYISLNICEDFAGGVDGIAWI